MSSRQLRKIRQQEELLKAAKAEKREGNHDSQEEAEEEEEDEEEAEPKVKPRTSLFAALGGDDDEEVEEEAQVSAPEPEQEDEHEATGGPTTTSKKKSKKKKKKGKKKLEQQQPGDSTAESVPKAEEPDEDEIDKALKGLKIQSLGKPSESNSKTRGSLSNFDKVLHVNPHSLRDIHELRQLFGRDAIESVQQTEREEERATRRQQARQRTVDLETFLRGNPGEKLPDVLLRKNIFVDGKEFWPRGTSGGLSMEEVRKDDEGGWVEYRYAHSEQYDKVQVGFFDRVSSGEPMTLVQYLKQNPYHISTLLQVSFYARHQDGNNPLAVDLCERALFTFGRSTLASFRKNVLEGKARLDFYRPENRQFWLVGYHYLKSLVRKGAHRTAFEWAKVVFAMDPVEDPYGMCHLLHILAVKGGETRWLDTFVKLFEKTNLRGDVRYHRNTIALGLVQEQAIVAAKSRLVEYMQDMPWLYCALFQALNLDAPPSIWGVQPPSEVDGFYTVLYVNMTKDMWNYPQATSVLKDAANSATKSRELRPTDTVLELRTARFVYLEDNKELIGRVPRSLLDRQPNYEFDPLPPAEADNIFDREGSRLPFRPDQRPLGAWLANAVAAAGGGGGGGGVRVRAIGGFGDDDDDDFDLDGEDHDLDGADEVGPLLEEVEGYEELDDDGMGDVMDENESVEEILVSGPASQFQRLSRTVRAALFGNADGGVDGQEYQRVAGSENAPGESNGHNRLPGAWPSNEENEQ